MNDSRPAPDVKSSMPAIMPAPSTMRATLFQCIVADILFAAIGRCKGAGPEGRCCSCFWTDSDPPSTQRRGQLVGTVGDFVNS